MRRKKPVKIDRRETHRLKRCPCCGGALQRCNRTRTRYTEDVPEIIEPEVTEHTPAEEQSVESLGPGRCDPGRADERLPNIAPPRRRPHHDHRRRPQDLPDYRTTPPATNLTRCTWLKSYLVNNAESSVLDSSTKPQTGSHNSIEWVTCTNDTASSVTAHIWVRRLERNGCESRAFEQMSPPSRLPVVRWCCKHLFAPKGQPYVSPGHRPGSATHMTKKL